MFKQAYKYKEWADKRTMQAIRQVDVNRHAKALGFLTQQVNHMTIVEELFRARLLQVEEPHAATNTLEVPDLGELEIRIRASNSWYLQYVTDLPAPGFEELVAFSFTAGNSGIMTRSDVLLHVLNHGTYHRGAMSHALDLADVAHPVDGYAKYLQDRRVRE